MHIALFLFVDLFTEQQIKYVKSEKKNDGYFIQKKCNQLK